MRLCEEAERRERAAGLSEEEKKRQEEALFTSSTIIHIRKVLYHWRSHQLSTAQNPEAKLYAFTAGERAVFDHAKRLGLPIEKVEAEALPTAIIIATMPWRRRKESFLLFP